MDELWMKSNPKSLEVVGTSKVKVLWADEHSSEYKMGYLREICPCSKCKEIRVSQPPEEWNFRAFFVTETPKMTGGYALSFVFNDGHREGIYSFEFLRKNCPCEQCESIEGAEEGKEAIETQDAEKLSS